MAKKQSTRVTASRKPTVHGELRSGPVAGTALVDGATFTQKPLLYANVDGEAIFEGDIVLGSVQQLQQTQARDIAQRSIGITGAQFRWPNGVVPTKLIPVCRTSKELRTRLHTGRRIPPFVSHFARRQTRRSSPILYVLYPAVAAPHLSANKVASRTSRLAPVAQRATPSTRSAIPSVCGMSKAEKIVTTL